MKQFNIYKKDPDNFDAVKVGWSWPAFFFGAIWAFSMRMWLLGIGIFVAYIIIIIAGAQDIVHGIGLLISIVLGIKGNEWRSKKLVSQGYKYLGKINASDPNDAIDIFTETAEENDTLSEQKSTVNLEHEIKKETTNLTRFAKGWVLFMVIGHLAVVFAQLPNLNTPAIAIFSALVAVMVIGFVLLYYKKPYGLYISLLSNILAFMVFNNMQSFNSSTTTYNVKGSIIFIIITFFVTKKQIKYY